MTTQGNLHTARGLFTEEDYEKEFDGNTDRLGGIRFYQEDDDEDKVDLKKLDYDHPSVIDDVAEYTLFLLRAIYDAYDLRGDKIIKNFRYSRFSKLLHAKRLMVVDAPEQLFREMNESDTICLEPKDGQDTTEKEEITLGEGKIKEDDSLNADLRGDLLKDLDDENDKMTHRPRIDKFGNEIDDNVKSVRERMPTAFMDFKGDQSSLYSHYTPNPVDEEVIDFKKLEGENMPHVPNLSETSDQSQIEIVYYHKEDMTEYSKDLGLNIVKKRKEQPALSEEDESSVGANDDKPFKGVDGQNNTKLTEEQKARIKEIKDIYGNEPANMLARRRETFSKTHFGQKWDELDRRSAQRSRRSGRSPGKSSRSGSPGSRQRSREKNAGKFFDSQTSFNLTEIER